MSINITVKGAKSLQTKLAKMEGGFHSVMLSALLLGALDIQSTAIKSIQQGGRSGKSYSKTKAKKQHIASAPGEPPKTDTGALVRNITIAKTGPLTVTVGSRETAPHGKWLEFGTSRVAARPWLRPAFSENEEKIIQRLIKVINNKQQEISRGR